MTIDDGVASTNNLRMRGVQAAVLMEGSADIGRETQDLRVLVVPEINAGTASLAYAVINPAVGLGTFLAQLFLRRPLMAASTREFTVQGSWADPQVERVERRIDAPLPELEAPAAASAPKTGRERPLAKRRTIMKIAALQTVSTSDVSRNLDAAARLIGQAAHKGATLAALPEYFCLMGRRDDDKLAIAEVPGQGPIQDFLGAQARAHGLWLIGGTLPLQTTAPGRVRNACCVYAPDGTLAARYDKIHLFRYDNGRESYDEARVLEAGSRTGHVAGRTAAVGAVGVLRPALPRAVPPAVYAAM